MKNFASPLVAACLCIPTFAGAEEPPDPPKTNSSLPVDEALYTQRPYSLNGMVFIPDGQGSGVVTGHRNLFLTASHVVYDDIAVPNKWLLPPVWFGGLHPSENQDGMLVYTRGYLRWMSYSTEAGLNGVASEGAFSNDIALAWGYQPFTEEEPATIDFNGGSKLRSGVPSMITGFPAEIDYTGESASGLHATKEEGTRYKTDKGNYITATHISTGPGNSGGPVWVRNEEDAWDVGAILISGRPSEAGLYSFSSSTKSLFKAAEPLVSDPRRTLKLTSKIGSNTYFAAMPKAKAIPDGKHKWTRIPMNIGVLPAGAIPEAVRVTVHATTTHRGDLLIALSGPNGTYALVHNGEGAWNDDLLTVDRDLTDSFLLMSEAPEGSTEQNTGKWYLLVQDRLTDDASVITKAELEVIIK